MREILFRGKRLDNGEWVDGCLAAYDLICPNYPEDTSNATGDYYGQTPYVGFIEVDPSTVGQFTGLTDKNGKRIFEGDILKFHKFRGEPDWIGYVKYDISMFIICGKQPMNSCGFEVELSGIDRNQCESIGNIHDNPELLEV